MKVKNVYKVDGLRRISGDVFEFKNEIVQAYSEKQAVYFFQKKWGFGCRDLKVNLIFDKSSENQEKYVQESLF